MRGNDRLQNLKVLRGDEIGGKNLNPLLVRRAHSGTQIRVTKQSCDRGCQASPITGIYEERVLTLDEMINRAAYASRDDRQSRIHCLRQHRWESFRPARQNENCGPAILMAEGGA